MVDESPLTVAQEMANVIFIMSQTEGPKLTANMCAQLIERCDGDLPAGSPFAE
jgi:hypothetical protein